MIDSLGYNVDLSFTLTLFLCHPLFLSIAIAFCLCLYICLSISSSDCLPIYSSASICLSIYQTVHNVEDEYLQRVDMLTVMIHLRLRLLCSVHQVILRDTAHCRYDKSWDVIIIYKNTKASLKVTTTTNKVSRHNTKQNRRNH